MLTFEYQIHKEICNPHLENYSSVVFPKGCLSLKFGFVKQLATSVQLRTNQLNYGFTNKRKKRTYPNKTITQIIICLIGIILRDVLLREYLHFAITINFKMQPNYNFFTSYTTSHVSRCPGQICVIFTRKKFLFRHLSFLSIYSARFFLINLQMKQFKVHL